LKDEAVAKEYANWTPLFSDPEHQASFRKTPLVLGRPSEPDHSVDKTPTKNTVQNPIVEHYYLRPKLEKEAREAKAKEEAAKKAAAAAAAAAPPK
jgi:hypothetical protein